MFIVKNLAGIFKGHRQRRVSNQGSTNLWKKGGVAGEVRQRQVPGRTGVEKR